MGRKVDIWGLGIVMQEMLYNGNPPLFELESFQYMYKLCSTKTPPATPDFANDQLRAIMEVCLVYDSDERGNADDVLRLCE